MTSSRDRLARTSANSAATNSPFSRTSNTSRTRRRALIAYRASASPSRGPVLRGGWSSPMEDGSTVAADPARGRGDDAPVRRPARRIAVRQRSRVQTMAERALDSAIDTRGDVDPAQREAPYLEALREYARRNPGRFHVPGHKGGRGADPALVEAIGEAAFELDIPAGIEGIDVGPDSP